MTVCVVGDALSLMVTVALKVPADAGWNVTVKVQLSPWASVTYPDPVPQESVAVTPTMKSVVSLDTMLRITRFAEPVLVTVTVCGALELPTLYVPKEMLVGLTDAMGGGVTPVPERSTVCVVGDALSMMVTVAPKVAADAGWNVTVKVQLTPGVSVVDTDPYPQELVGPDPRMKSVESLDLMLVIPRVAEPVLVTVTVCGLLLVVTT